MVKFRVGFWVVFDVIVAVVPVIGFEIVQTKFRGTLLPLQVGAMDVLLIFTVNGEHPLAGEVVNWQTGGLITQMFRTLVLIPQLL